MSMSHMAFFGAPGHKMIPINLFLIDFFIKWLYLCHLFIYLSFLNLFIFQSKNHYLTKIVIIY